MTDKKRADYYDAKLINIDFVEQQIKNNILLSISEKQFLLDLIESNWSLHKNDT